MADVLDKVKKSLGVTGEYQDGTLTEYINEVKGYLLDAGVPLAVIESDVSAGIISRGVSDLWNYGSGKLSEYFFQRASQLVYSVESGTYITLSAGDYGITYPVNLIGVDIAETDTVKFICKVDADTTIVKEYTGITNNCVLITFTESESNSIPKGTYNWALKITNDISVVTAIPDGRLIVF